MRVINEVTGDRKDVTSTDIAYRWNSNQVLIHRANDVWDLYEWRGRGDGVIVIGQYLGEDYP